MVKELCAQLRVFCTVKDLFITALSKIKNVVSAVQKLLIARKESYVVQNVLIKPSSNNNERHMSDIYENTKKQEKNFVELKLPIRTVSEANSSEHWTEKHKRHKKQKFIVRAYLNKVPRSSIKLPVAIHLTRIAPRQLDRDDNLPMAFKYVKDYICDYIIPGLQAGRADDTHQISFSYSQEKGKPKEYAIIIKMGHI